MFDVPSFHRAERFSFCGLRLPIAGTLSTGIAVMRMITGAILLLASEQAFAHAYSIGFPHQAYASQVLVPSSAILGLLGLGFLVWGLAMDHRK